VRKLCQKSFIILATFDTQIKLYKEDVMIFFLFSPKTFSSSSMKDKEKRNIKNKINVYISIDSSAVTFRIMTLSRINSTDHNATPCNGPNPGTQHNIDSY
jgi:hypothetical protein